MVNGLRAPVPPDEREPTDVVILLGVTPVSPRALDHVCLSFKVIWYCVFQNALILIGCNFFWYRHIRMHGAGHIEVGSEPQGGGNGS